MDEIWQRHKTFILQCVIGGLAFLIAFVVITNAYSGITETQVSNQGLKRDLEKRLNEKQAPSSASIQAQKAKAVDAAEQIRTMSALVASQAQGEDYVRENIVWALAVAGKPATDAERFLALYRQLPETCLTSVREEARAALVGQAAQRGKHIDETFGLAAGVTAEDVPGGLHALAIVCDVIGRALERDGIVSVTEVRVNPRNAINRDLSWVTGVEVRLAVTGDPDDVMAVIRGFDGLSSHARRMVVLREIESITRRGVEDDTVKANLVLLGLQVKSAQGDDR